MKWVQRIQTRDGALHETAREAKKHAEVMYGNKLLPLAGKLAQMDKYSAVSDYLDANLDTFLELKALKDDLELIPTEDN